MRRTGRTTAELVAGRALSTADLYSSVLSTPAVSARALVESLNDEQRRAVEAGDGPVLIFAGAGSGKTRVLTHRIAHIIATRGVRPSEICAVTFTNKAAREMRGRLESLLGGGLSGMWLGTFHALGVRMLRRDGDHIGIPSNFTIFDEGDRVAAVRRALREEGIDEKRYSPSRIGHAISAAKNEMRDPVAYRARAEGPFEELVARAYTAYERELRAARALDFDDLLGEAVRLLRESDDIRQEYQHRFRHLFVDEYQDTNQAQYLLVSTLAAAHRHLTVVGDDDQVIYSFRGADVRTILSFRRDYPDATVITLEQNYRSTQGILDVAHALIRINSDRAEKRLWTDRGPGSMPRLISVFDEQEEALAVAGEISALIGSDGYSLRDCAVLYRTNAQSRSFEEVFLRREIPYQLIGGVRFYERREVRDILAYLRLIANPRDAVAFARIVNVPRRRIGERTVAELEGLARQHGLSPLEAIDVAAGTTLHGSPAAAPLAAFGRMIGALVELAGRVPVPQLLERLITDTGYGAMLQDGTPEGEERWANLTELIGLAGEYADVPAPDGLQQFLENAALVSDVDGLDEAAPGVTLITLHQVKGLEFPVVFLAGMEEGLLPHLRALEEGDEGLAEERRLTYVGVTRAQRRLYLLHAFRRHIHGAPRLSEASRFLSEIPRDLIEVTSLRGRRPAGDPRAPGAVRAAVHARAVRPNPVTVAAQRFRQGMRVEHRRYGQGTVLKSTMTRAGEEVVITFDTAGMKIFSVGDATLTTIG